MDNEEVNSGDQTIRGYVPARFAPRSEVRRMIRSLRRSILFVPLVLFMAASTIYCLINLIVGAPAPRAAPGFLLVIYLIGLWPFYRRISEGSKAVEARYPSGAPLELTPAASELKVHVNGTTIRIDLSDVNLIERRGDFVYLIRNPRGRISVVPSSVVPQWLVTKIETTLIPAQVKLTDRL